MEEILYSITRKDFQEEALEIFGRELTEEEIQKAKKALDYGINTSLPFIVDSIFEELNGLGE